MVITEPAVPIARLLGLVFKLYSRNMPRMLNKDLTRIMQRLSRVQQNQASERRALLAGCMGICSYSQPDCAFFISFFFGPKTSEASSQKNEEVTDDLKTLLHEVRSLILSFQAHVSLQTVTPARGPDTAMAPRGPPERGPVDDASVHPSEPDNGAEYQTTVRDVGAPKKVHCEGTSQGEGRGEEPNSKHHKNQLSKEHMRTRPVVYSKHKQELERGSISSLTTDLNSRISSNSDGDDIEEFALPLHSSSPKKDSIASSEVHSDFSQTLDKYLPLSASSNSSDSEVTSLFIDQTTSTGDTVISRDGLDTAHYNRKSRSSAFSVSSSQRSSSQKSDEVQFLKPRSRPALQDPQAKQHNDVITSRHLTMRRKQDKPSSGKQGKLVKCIVKAGFPCLDHLDFLRRMDDGVDPNIFTKTRLYIYQAIVIAPVAVSSRISI